MGVEWGGRRRRWPTPVQMLERLVDWLESPTVDLERIAWRICLLFALYVTGHVLVAVALGRI